MRHYLFAAVGVVVFFFGFRFVADHHIGAPSSGMVCPPPYHLETSWYTQSQLASAEAGGKSPGGVSVVHYLGWTELVGCGQSLTATTGAR